MESNTALKSQERTEKEFKYEEKYKMIQQVFGENPMLVQSFIYSNTPDIVSAINFWRDELKDASTKEEKADIENMIIRLKNLMKQRVDITEDIFANYLPILNMGPFEKEEPKKVKEVKTVEHPASKGKKKETVNEKIGREKVEGQTNTKEVSTEEDDELKLKNEDTSYAYLYPTEKQQLDDINDKLIPNLEKYLKGEKKDMEKAKLICRHHFRNFGKNDHFCMDSDIARFIKWLQSEKFQARSPLDIINNKPLKIEDIITEVDSLIIEGKTRKEIRNYLAEELINTKIEGWENPMKSERDFVKFFHGVIQYLFDDAHQRELKFKSEKSQETRESVKQNLYQLYKNEAKHAVTKMAKEFRAWLLSIGKETDIKAALAEFLAFLKGKDPELHNKYMAQRNHKKPANSEDQEQTAKNKGSEKPKEANKANGSSGTKNTTSSKVEYPRLEEYLKHHDKKPALTEFLLTIINKKLNPIGLMKNGRDAQIAELTKLAEKRILEMGLKPDEDTKSYDDWTKEDVAKYMDQEIVPYITGEYAILSAESDSEIKEHLNYYMTAYPAGKEKDRIKALKKVLVSKVPRHKYVSKGIAKQARRDKFDEINAFIKELNEADNETVNSESE